MSSIAGDAIEWNSTATLHKTCFAGYDFSPKLNYPRQAGCTLLSGATEPAERVSCSIDVGLQPMSSIALTVDGTESTIAKQVRVTLNQLTYF